jgi:hypothetical protein
VTGQQKTLLYCGIYLAIIWVLASLPLAFVLYEFRDIPLCRSISLGWFAATFYGPFFIYPFFIGGLAAAALCLPLAAAVSRVQKSTTAAPVVHAFFVCTVYVGVTAAIAYVEFAQSPHAVLEIAPGVLNAHPGALDGLMAACNGEPYRSHATDLGGLILQGSSYTHWAYDVGFVAQVLLQAAIFAVFFVFNYDNRRFVQAAPYARDSIAFLLGYAVFLGSIWCLFLLTYRHESSLLLGTDNVRHGDYSIVGFYGLVLIIFVGYFACNRRKSAKISSAIKPSRAMGQLLFSIGQVLFLAGGVAAVELETAQASRFFGSHASIVSIFILCLFFALTTALARALTRAQDGKPWNGKP